MPKAYVICDNDVTDPEEYAAYRELSTAAGEKYGATYLVRGGATTVLEGDWAPGRLVILEFEDAAAAHRWYDSPEYAAAREVRQRSATSSFLLAEGA
jgi:uncharacterized protein (DUF1330 family)